MAGMKPQYPTATHPVVAEILNGFAVYDTLDDAQYQLNLLYKNYSRSKKFHTSANPDSQDFTMWVQDLDLDDRLIEEGFRGKYARFHLQETSDGFECVADILDIPLSNHPKQNPWAKRDRQHPNTGHPVIRGALNEQKFETEQEAIAQIARLKKEFPRTSRRVSDNKIFFILWRGDEKKTEKMVAKVVLTTDMEWKIRLYSNETHKNQQRRFYEDLADTNEAMITTSHYLKLLSDFTEGLAKNA